MNCHQILSGACNAGDRCFAVGSVEGIPFTAYAAGCNIVILASTFERVQIIPGAIHNYVRISCVDCSTDTGKIAAAYENQVCIFEPTPLIHNNSAHQLDYRWVQTGSWQTESRISSLSWNLEGTRLLTGGEVLQLWHQHISPHLLEDDNEMGGGGGGVTFEIGEEAGESTGCNKGPASLPPGLDEEDRGWECVWKCHTATPILHMAFSPDGTLFATAGRNDRLVKIWFENKQLLFPSKTVEHSQSVSLCQPNTTELNYGFVYISHPRAVTQLSWRKTSKYMPKGSVSNMLVTSCRDNICRIWVETVLPDDGLVNMHQFDPLAAHNPKFRTHRHKHRFMQRLKHMKTCFHIRRHAKHQQNQSSGPVPIPTLPSTYSVHDFHSYGFHGTGVTPGLHFHLAASINAETDIPLVPSLVTGDPEREPNFVLHWLNNKEMHFSLQAEAILHDLTRKVVEKEEGLGLDSSNPESSEQHDSQHDEHTSGKKRAQGKIAKSLSQDESGSDEHHAASSFPSSSHQTLSNATSINSLATDTGPTVGHVPDSLDTKIECLLRDWHHSPDLLFAIHPIDGSFLIWVIEWLDEYHPGSFRQAQVSFSTRIPSAFPLGDATTMSNNVCLYHTSGCHLQLVFRDVVKTAAAATTKTSSPAGPGSDAGGEPTTPLPSVMEEDADDELNRETGEEATEGKTGQTTTGNGSSAGESGHSSGVGGTGGSFNDILSAPPSPTLSMVTKHSNGTLNLWQLTFADKTKFSQVLSIGHASRASGHRFRVNDITCHPVLPLLLTTSHHNLPEGTTNTPTSPSPQDPTAPTGFCSELILWRVDAVGPLSKSGGVSELARINSPQISAFSNVAWIPTLLPSTTLGNLSNSPSACFVASDGESLRVYQAVIDARTLLAEVSSSERRSRIMGSLVSLSTDLSSEDGAKHSSLHDRIKIVSQQSTARPGCVIQLDAISDATHDWQNTQFLHVFQEQLITGVRTDTDSSRTGGVGSGVGGDLGFMESQLSAIVDLHQTAEFEEPFYLVVLERTTQGTTIHMWRLVIASQSDNDELSGSMMYVPDSHLVQDDDDLESSGRAAGTIEDDAQALLHPPHVTISTTKVCTQELPLPDGVDVIHASPAGGHLSSASIYPACFAPYIIVTACSDSTVRFWKCVVEKDEEEIGQGQGQTSSIYKYHWAEWEMLRKDKESMIDVPGQPLNISAAYSGRIACAYKYGKSFTRPSRKDPDSRYVNLCVAIYECESTGGSEWVLEDTLYLKNIHLPRIQVDPSVDLSYLYDQTFLTKKQRLQTNFIKAISSEDLDSRSAHRNGEHNGSSDNNLVKSGAVFGSTKNTRELELVYKDDNFLTVPQWHPMGGQHLELPAEKCLLAVPSFSTLQSLRRSITENGNTCPLTQKHLVQLDWVSKEDGSHILTVAVGSKVMLFTPVSSDLAQANMKAMKESQSTNRPILRKASSLAAPNFVDEIRWMKLRRIDLSTADGLPPLPMQISWVRDGILVVGMDSEMHVYSQWKPDSIRTKSILSRLPHQESEEMQDTRNLRDEDLRSLAQESSQRRLANVSSMPHLSRVSSINLTMMSVECKKKRATSTSGGGNGGLQSEPVSNMDSYMPDYGLFEASRIACPVLPQYHPKQLMELLNSGKIRWVKAILAHLVRCISGTCSVRQGAVVCTFSDEENLTRQRGWSRSRTLSVSYAAGTTSPLEQRGSTTAIPEELMLDYAEITSIPPLPLWTLLAADKETLTKPQGCDDQKDYNELFDGNVSAGDQTLDDLLEDDDEPDSPMKRERRQSGNTEKQSTLSHFGPRQGRLLSRLLTHTHLPGLSSLDQMHLLALADTVSTCNTDFAERFVIDAAKTAIAKENLTGTPEGDPTSSDSLDDCGLRFLLAMKHYNYLLRCLPIVQRAKFQKQGISTNNLVWAFHSESEEELLQLIPSYAKGNPKWSQLKELGVGWWLRNHTLLKTCIEKVAKAAYQANQDPLDAAIFYLAMKKKSLVWGLYRSRRDDRMTAFFANDFSEDRWRKAALKNAFALLGKQRFEHAAAFFMLAGALRDAIEVCLNKLDDLQLAMVIARLYEGEMDSTPPNVKRLLYEEILGCDSKGENQSMSQVHPDPFLRSMALWILKDFTGSLNTLLQTNVGTMHSQYNNDDDKQEGSTANPNVFNFYVYLRTHPLLIRQYLASTYQDKKKHTVVLSGFSYGSDSKTSNSDRQLLLEDSITPLERQLYFTTAHAHFKAGCPALALEVLSKLPTKVMEDTTSIVNSPSKTKVQDTQIDTGILCWDEPTTTQSLTQSEDRAESLTNGGNADMGFDWSQPASKIKEDELVLKWDDDDELKDEDDDDDDDTKIKSDDKPLEMKIDKQDSVETNGSRNSDGKNGQNGQMDIMAQQLKFVACLKILMEELSTLATGYEVDGGQLRYQLYLWLEREVDALRQLCNYSAGDVDIAEASYEVIGEGSQELREYNNTPTFNKDKPTLYEILMAEKSDFEAKVQRAARRKKWLKANETLLRTLLSYCSLHGASGGGLASVRMELVLLLQELQQEKTQQQLLSPLPFPTTLPLLSASVACNKTVVADPVRLLQALTHDMLQTIIEMRSPPSLTRVNLSEVFVLRDLSVALSACIYQSLCDSDSCSVKQSSDCYQGLGPENLSCVNASSHLIATQHRKRRYSTDEPLQVTTLPSKWPGVTNLRALLAREKDEDTPRLNVLLCEAFVGAYMSLVVYAIATCDCHILYRLAGQKFNNNNTWAILFGGGVKKLLRVATSSPQSAIAQSSVDQDAGPSSDAGVWTAVTSLTKQRVRLNMKLLGQFGSQPGTPTIKEDKPTYREQFVPPEMSMVSYFLNKPHLAEEAQEVDYDSADSAVSDLSDEEEEDVFEGDTTKDKNSSALSGTQRENTEHSNPTSYSWCIMRLAIMRLVQGQLQDFLNTAGIELQELPVSSPLIHGVLRVVSQWSEVLREELEMRGPPPSDYIPGCYVEASAPGPPIHKYRSLLDKGNTPFHPRHWSAAPARRLWSFLVRQEPVQDLFIRCVFGKRKTGSVLDTVSIVGDNEKPSTDPAQNLPEPVRIIHKEQDSISAFCLNQVNGSYLALATPREVQEMDIALLLELPSWLEDECEFDIINLNKEPEQLPASGFLVIQTACDKPLLSQPLGTINLQNNSSNPQPGMAGQTGRGASVRSPSTGGDSVASGVAVSSGKGVRVNKNPSVLKHRVDGIRRISAHPLLPLYLTGSQDGSVQMWEWGHQQAVTMARPAGTFAKVTRVRFSQHGNKFGVADGDGNLSLFQVGLASTVSRPFFTYQCHNKVTSDFVFLGSCSLVATAGHSSESKNVALWDTLLPQKKSLIAAFTCHDQGASSLVFAPQHQLLISAGKKGDVCILDVRQRQMRHRFMAHESPVKCLAIDPAEEFFATGAADGDIKVWGLTIHHLLFSFPGEHARSSFFKHIGQGVTQLHIDAAARLFSCGADGSMKVRQLPERDLTLHTLY
ncbi:rabconnectin-3 alpha isoform X2 [Lycorma delicatula]|uniref:rabconnectin-3 alpha isoform X2 n=1 Tax=Lycorma delicatula TaxID=130591 RepID=UPI003F51AB36